MMTPQHTSKLVHQSSLDICQTPDGPPAQLMKPRQVSRRDRKTAPTVEAALLVLSSDSLKGDRLPCITTAVRQGEFIHQALVSILNRQLGVRDCRSLIGRDARGHKLQQGHQHAHYFSIDLDDDRRIDHVLVYAPAGLDANAQRAITRLRRTWTKASYTDTLVTCAGFGDLNLFRRQLRYRGGRPVAIVPPQPACVWTSYTPYVPPRHLKPKNSRYTLADDVRRELALRGLPVPVEIEVFQQQGQDNKRQPPDQDLVKFVRTRIDSKPQPPKPWAFGVRVVFNEPQPGPIAIGYGCHFGLGLFAAE